VAAVIAVDDFAQDGLAMRVAAEARPTMRPIWTDGVTQRPELDVEEQRTFGGVGP
jgi:acyl-CoA dehydrogenase